MATASSLTTSQRCMNRAAAPRLVDHLLGLASRAIDHRSTRRRDTRIRGTRTTEATRSPTTRFPTPSLPSTSHRHPCPSPPAASLTGTRVPRRMKATRIPRQPTPIPVASSTRTGASASAADDADLHVLRQCSHQRDDDDEPSACACDTATQQPDHR